MVFQLSSMILRQIVRMLTPCFSASHLKKKKKKNSIALRLIDDTPAKSHVDSSSQHKSQDSGHAELAEPVQTQHESQDSGQVDLAEVVEAPIEQEVSLASETKKPKKQKRNTES